MAFHVACPITCQRVCFCTLGFPQNLQSDKGRKNFLDEVFRVEEFLRDPWLVRDKERSTVQVAVPRIVSPTVAVVDGFGGGGDGEELLSVQAKRAAMQKKAVVVSLVAEDYARKFETGDLVDISRETVQDLAGEDQGSSTINLMCRLCFNGEIEGSERSRRMLACKICNKKSISLELMDLSLLPNLYAEEPEIQISSCFVKGVMALIIATASSLLTRMFRLDLICAQNIRGVIVVGPRSQEMDRVQDKVEKPVVLLVIRLVALDLVIRDEIRGIHNAWKTGPEITIGDSLFLVYMFCSDEKYLQFQADRNLYYKCAACRGDCYQVRDLDDAVQELWSRRDKADCDQIAILRATAGLPTQEEIFCISPYSDDEDSNPAILKNDYGRSVKFSLKGLVSKSPKKTKEYGKKSSNKKYVKKKGYHATLVSQTGAPQSFETLHNTQSYECGLGDEKNDDMRSYRSEATDTFSSVPGSPGNSKGICSINQAGILKHKFIEEVVVSNEDKASRNVQIKSSKSRGLDIEEGTEKHASKSETMKGKKLVIHLGARKRNVSNSPRSEASSCHREQDVTASNGSEDTSQQRTNSKKYMVEAHGGKDRFGEGKGERHDVANNIKGSKLIGREGNLIKLGKVKEVSDLNPKIGRGNIEERYESIAVEKTRVLLEKRNTEGSTATEESKRLMIEATTKRDGYVRKNPKNTSNVCSESYDNSLTPVMDSLPKDPKPLLKLKFKNPYLENRSSWVPHGEEEKSPVKGQRSKRKRPSPLMEKVPVREDEDKTQLHLENPINEVMDANWILKKLGKDAIGKRVEVHQASDNSWHKGVVTDMIEGTSTLSVHLDDGRAKTLDLGKQGIRFVSQKQKRSKT
ncbi:hypothetical protein HHK36_017760 [Tetracentron sinense]|uniref:Uncharacterized protein n=1 Tax=Tetracentron sinense TaxID=13715 RepID=A0A834YXP9_TETSI|nr:hypothetical protein HHK36_017760 [Tetracentron sinense]